MYNGEHLDNIRKTHSRISRITIFPVKSLEGQEIDRVTTTAEGGLAGDRLFAFFSRTQGTWIRAKAYPKLISIRSEVRLSDSQIQLAVNGQIQQFNLEDDADLIGKWMSEYLEHPVELRKAPLHGYFDDSNLKRFGISVISTATLTRLCEWFPHCTLTEMRRRMRVNIEVEGVDAFWEDAMIPNPGEAGRLQIGTVDFAAALSCSRCTVPERNSVTGVADQLFKSEFIRLRTEQFPEFVNPDLFRTKYSAGIRLVGLPRLSEAQIGIGDLVGWKSV